MFVVREKITLILKRQRCEVILTTVNLNHNFFHHNQKIYFSYIIFNGVKENYNYDAMDIPTAKKVLQEVNKINQEKLNNYLLVSLKNMVCLIESGIIN